MINNICQLHNQSELSQCVLVNGQKLLMKDFKDQLFQDITFRKA